MGRVATLRKPDGGIRVMVVGDITKIDRTHHRTTDLETSRGSDRTTLVRIADEVC